MAANGHRTNSFADSRLSVQFDRIDLAERGCAALAAEARRAGADAVPFRDIWRFFTGEEIPYEFGHVCLRTTPT